MSFAVIIIDIQNDYFAGGKSELDNPGLASSQASKLLEYSRKVFAPVYHVQHVNTRPGAAFFLPDTHGVQIHESVKPLAGETVIIKHAPNAFFETKLADELTKNKITDIVVCGMMSHMCIDTTVRAARDFGLKVTLLHDACTTKNLVWNGVVIPAKTVHQTFMASLNGMFAEVISTDEFLTRL